MATIAGSVRGIVLLNEELNGDDGYGALVYFTMGAYTAASDNGQLTNIATAIQNTRRDGKTVTLVDACHARRGAQSTTEFETRTWAVSSGSLTFNVTNTSGSEVDAASGVTTRPLCAYVAYTLS